jgi:hypothetical protein
MEEVAEDGKESTNSAHANGMNEIFLLIYDFKPLLLYLNPLVS